MWVRGKLLTCNIPAGKTAQDCKRMARGQYMKGHTFLFPYRWTWGNNESNSSSSPHPHHTGTTSYITTSGLQILINLKTSLIYSQGRKWFICFSLSHPRNRLACRWWRSHLYRCHFSLLLYLLLLLRDLDANQRSQRRASTLIFRLKLKTVQSVAHFAERPPSAALASSS